MHLNLKRLLFSFLGIIFLIPSYSSAQFEKGILMEGLITTHHFEYPYRFEHFGVTAGAFGRYLFVGKVPSNALYIEANLGLSRLTGLPLVAEDCTRRNQFGECYYVLTDDYLIDYLLLFSLSGGLKTSIRNVPVQASLGAELSHFPDLWRHPNGIYGSYGGGWYYSYNKNAWNILMNIGIPINKFKLLDSIMITYKHSQARHSNFGHTSRRVRQVGITLKISL